MNCPKCGAIYIAEDVKCKKCGHVLHSIEGYYGLDQSSKGANDEVNIQYKSRWLLLLNAYIGSWRGKHLKYLGFTQEAERVRNKYKIGMFGFLSFEGALTLIMAMGYHIFIVCKVLFGGFKNDAYGNPVRWFKPKQ